MWRLGWGDQPNIEIKIFPDLPVARARVFVDLSPARVRQFRKTIGTAILPKDRHYSHPLCKIPIINIGTNLKFSRKVDRIFLYEVAFPYVFLRRILDYLSDACI
jgi:hypothetical protein